MKQCFYDVLGVEQRASVDEIKRAYRDLALKCHPDKNRENPVAAQQQFVLVQEAYETLSDPAEREWYDSHRSQILQGETACTGASGFDASGARINIYSWFRKDCFSGYSEKTDNTGGKNCFYTVYSGVFSKIVEEELSNALDKSSNDYKAMAKAPSFGTSSSSVQDANVFYKFWSQFTSQKTYAFAGQWNLNEAPNRAIRRQMELENKTARSHARKEFSSAVRALAAWLKKRDPRIIAATAEKIAKAQRLSKEATMRREALLKERRLQKANADQLERERWELLEKDKQEARLQKQVFLQDSDFSDVENVTHEAGDVKNNQAPTASSNVMYICEACRRLFRSEAQFISHERSKKHQRTVAELLQRYEANEHFELDQPNENSPITLDGPDLNDDAANENDSEKKARRRAEERCSAADGDRSDHDDVSSRASVKLKEKQPNFGTPDNAVLDTAFDNVPDISSNSVTSSSSNANSDSSNSEADAQGSSSESVTDEDSLLEAMHKLHLRRRQRRQSLSSSESGMDPDVQHSYETEGSRQCTTNQPTSEAAQVDPFEQRIKRRTKKQTAVRSQNSASSSHFACEICKAPFPTKNKLFQHIRSTGHAALKPLTTNKKQVQKRR